MYTKKDNLKLKLYVLGGPGLLNILAEKKFKIGCHTTTGTLSHDVKISYSGISATTGPWPSNNQVIWFSGSSSCPIGSSSICALSSV